MFSFKFLNHLNPEHPAANALMISLVGIAVKITGAEIPGLNLEVKINMMQLVITVELVRFPNPLAFGSDFPKSGGDPV